MVTLDLLLFMSIVFSSRCSWSTKLLLQWQMIQSVILNLQTMWSSDKGTVAPRDSLPLIYFHSSGCLDAHNKSPYRPGMLLDDRFARWSSLHICREYGEKERWMGSSSSSPSVWPLVTLRVEIYWNGGGGGLKKLAWIRFWQHSINHWISYLRRCHSGLFPYFILCCRCPGWWRSTVVSITPFGRSEDHLNFDQRSCGILKICTFGGLIIIKKDYR